MTYDFQERLAFSQGARRASDIETIMGILDGCISVTENAVNGNDQGVDYIATLRRGANVLIDAKTRAVGCSKYWKNKEPELAIERWSVMPSGKFHTPAQKAKAGWTIENAIQECCLRNWASFKAEWVADKQPQGTSFRERDEAEKRRKWEEMTGRKWPTENNTTFIEAETNFLEIGHD